MRYIFLSLGLLVSIMAKSQTYIIPTEDDKIILSPVLHGSFVLGWDTKAIYVDPYGGAELYKEFPLPSLVLITHTHGDHLDKATLRGLDLSKTELIAPKLVIDQLEDIKFSKVTVLANGEDTEWEDVEIEAIPMYNLPEETVRHKKGDGNGYVLEIEDVRIYISGDTEGIPEMRNLEDIDYAFVCMNLPYTMDVEQAADAVLDFKPKVVYPYHYRGAENKFSDVEKFKRLVNEKNSEIEVVLADWYPNKK